MFMNLKLAMVGCFRLWGVPHVVGLEGFRLLLVDNYRRIRKIKLHMIVLVNLGSVLMIYFPYMTSDFIAGV